MLCQTVKQRIPSLLRLLRHAETVTLCFSFPILLHFVVVRAAAACPCASSSYRRRPVVPSLQAAHSPRLHASAAALNMAASAKQLTLVMLHCGQRILLGMKKRGFGVGKINVRARVVPKPPLACMYAKIFSRGLAGKLNLGNQSMMRR
jgi:hypothetical protein